MIIKTSIDFTKIRKTLDAAENLQDAGKDADCRKILSDLSTDIVKELKEAN